jgi:hypothetical protein
MEETRDDLRYQDATATVQIEAIATYVGLTPEDFLNDEDSMKKRCVKWTEKDSKRVLPQFEAVMDEDAPADWRSLL